MGWRDTIEIIDGVEVVTKTAKEKKKESDKKYKEANKDKIKAANKKYVEANKDKIKEYYKSNKEKIKEYNKQYNEVNKDRIKEYKEANKDKIKEYKQSPQGKKVASISEWKRRGVKHDNFDELYTIYLNCTNCMVCDKKFKNTRDRCLDHSHETGLYRNVLCQSCNNRDHWKKVIEQQQKE
jgi:hypothetical protein